MTVEGLSGKPGCTKRPIGTRYLSTLDQLARPLSQDFDATSLPCRLSVEYGRCGGIWLGKLLTGHTHVRGIIIRRRGGSLDADAERQSTRYGGSVACIKGYIGAARPVRRSGECHVKS
jgi:hypothetical protein